MEPRTTLTCKTPVDVLASVPIALGFHPAESVVMLTFGAAAQFHARIDMPTTGAECAEVAAALCNPCKAHGVERVLFVHYSARDYRVSDAHTALSNLFRVQGVEVVEALHVHPVHGWRSIAGSHAPWTPIPAEVHPFTCEGVAAGVVVRKSREDLATAIAYDGSEPDDDTARMLAAMDIPDQRDAYLSSLTMATARETTERLAMMLRTVAPGQRANLASVLAVAQWLSGDGAAAWVAVDAARADGGTSLADLADALLSKAVPPSVWEDPVAGFRA